MSLRYPGHRFLATLTTLLALPNGGAAQSAAPRDAQPRLVVFLAVDQLRADYLDRWARQLTGGLGRLSQRGAYFPNAFQDHAVTETAPGHASMLSGRFPRSTGILRNAAGVEDPQAPLVTSRDAGASPFRFRGSTLIDWMRSGDPRSRALSISRKDRGAILPLGRAKQSVFWYATSSGEFTTSRYYADTLPTWIQRVNARRVPQRLAGQSWTLLLPAREYVEPDSVPVEGAGNDYVFPHALSRDPVRAAAELPTTPWMDELTLDAALEGVQALNLGRGPHADLLAISLSATDYIGHRYGPDSREQHDNVLRLDRNLGAFIDSLYRLRDSSTIVFALTADHGATPFPEIVAQRTGRPATPRYDLASISRTVRGIVQAAGVNPDAIAVDGGVVSIDRKAFDRARVNPDPLLARVADTLRRRPGIGRVDRVRDLARRDTLRDVVSRRWLHTLPPDIPAEYVVTPVQGAYPVGARSAQHGSPYDDDARVPLIFFGAGIRPGRITERTLVVDAAPTLARVIGVTPTERLDGRVLLRALADGRGR
ncbi:MAG TPA: alkaline phosphatase family protein [Gemmatimonadaceae bacterium]|nr:alkaline phosphatase family protein [Gemmatimonadaceae bacterium]